MKCIGTRACLFLSILFCLTLSSTRPSQSAAALVVVPDTPDVSVAPPHKITFTCGQLRYGTPDRSCTPCVKLKDATLKNLGDTAVTITSVKTITTQPSNNPNYSHKNECPQTLAPGQSCKIEVRWNARSISSAGELLVDIKGLGSPKTLSLDGWNFCEQD